MTHSIPSTIPQQKIRLTPLLHLKTPEETISFAKDEWLEQLNQIPEEKRGSYRAGIDLVIQELQNKSIILKNEGYQSQQIISELSKTISLYNTSYALFEQKTASYNQQKVAEENQNLTLGEKFRRAGRSFQVYHLPEQTPKDPLEAQAQWEALEVLGGMHAVGTVLQLTGATVAEGAKQLCKLTKTTETACKATLDFGKTVVHATKIDKAIQYVQTHGGASLAQVLEEHYGFPKDQAEQLGHQHIDDWLLTATAGGTGIASHLLFKHLFKPTPLSEAVVAASAELPVNTAARFTSLNRGYTIETQNYTVCIPEISFTAPPGQQALPTTAPLATETSQNLFQLGRPNNVATTFERLKSHIETGESHHTMGAIIGNEQKILNYLVPALCSDGKKVLDRVAFQEIWKSPWTQSTILVDASTKFIRKEFHSFRNSLSEFIGLSFLRSLDLRRTAFAEPIAFWTNGEQGTLIKTLIPGYPLQEWMSAVGKLPASSRERVLGVSRLKAMAFSAGKSVGELQAKGSHLPPLAESELSSAARSIISDVENNFSTLNADLKFVGKRFQTDPKEFLDPLYKRFERDPGPASFGFGNIYGSEFFFSLEKARPFACLNAKDTLWRLNNKGVPNQLVAEEHALFRRLFLYDGFKAGLEMAEIKEILRVFEIGYRLEYRGPPIPQAASQIYDLYASLQTISLSAARLEGTKDLRLHGLIDSQMRQLEQKLRIYSMPEESPAAYAPCSVEY